MSKPKLTPPGPSRSISSIPARHPQSHGTILRIPLEVALDEETLKSIAAMIDGAWNGRRASPVEAKQFMGDLMAKNLQQILLQSAELK